MPGSMVFFTHSSFCSGVQRLRRWTPMMTSTSFCFPEGIGVSIAVFLVTTLGNTTGPAIYGATSRPSPAALDASYDLDTFHFHSKT